MLASGTISGEFDMDRCGSMIAWDHFHKGEMRPDLLTEIDKQDRWLADRDPKIIMSLRSWAHKPQNESIESWAELMDKWSHLMSSPGTEQLKKDGAAIFRYYRQRIDETKGHERIILIDGHEFPAINAPFFMASDIAGELAEELAGVGAVWWQNKDGSVIFSLRSRGSIDVSQTAKSMGGGGHANAAGFKVSKKVAAEMLFDLTDLKSGDAA